MEFEVINPTNQEILGDPTSFEFDLKNLKLIQGLFFDVINQLAGKPLPEFYLINKIALSLNELQLGRFLEKNFLYLHTTHRKTIFDKMTNLMNSKKFTSGLTGLQGTGKSHFLADFVLRHRLSFDKSKIRIMYINNSVLYFANPTNYILNELIYMVCLDLNIDQFNMEEDSVEIPENIINNSNDIIKWLLFLHKKKSVEKIKVFVECLKSYYNKIGIKLVIVWDQINVFSQEDKKNQNMELELYKSFSKSYEFFDCILLSASNNNKQINSSTDSGWKPLDQLDPVQVFDHDEFSKLLKFETYCYHYLPNDINNNENFEKFAAELSQLTNYSISEYFSYKKAFRDEEEKTFLFNSKSWQEIKRIYKERRCFQINKSEVKFQQKYLSNNLELLEYYIAMKYLLTFEEKQNMDESIKVKN